MEKKERKIYRVIVSPSKLFKSSLVPEKNEVMEFEVDESVLRSRLTIENVKPHPLFLFLPITLNFRLSSNFWFYEVVFNPMTGEFEVILMGESREGGDVVEEEMEMRIMPDYLKHLYPVMRIYPGKVSDAGNSRKRSSSKNCLVLSLDELRFFDDCDFLDFLKDEQVYRVFCSVFPEKMHCSDKEGRIDEKKFREKLLTKRFRHVVRGFVQALFLSQVFFEVIPSAEDVLNYLKQNNSLIES